MQFERIYDEGLAQAAYMIGCPDSGELAVVDPSRDIDTFIDWATANDYDITAVAETHIHADFLSGGRELAEAVGATLYVSDETDEGWHYDGLDELETEVVTLEDEEEFGVGNVVIEALHTPGHTPEHISYLITDKGVTEAPMMILTGDFVFVGDLGRPDLLEKAAGEADTAKQWAEVLYESVKNTFLELPDDVQVWPGHGAGSACGKALGAIPASTVGYEKKHSWWAPFFEEEDKAGFVDAILEDQPESPYYFKNMKLMNRDGPPLLEGVPSPRRLSPQKFRQLLNEGAALLDLREGESYTTRHLRGAVDIPSVKNISTYAGWVVDYDQPIVLQGDPEDVAEANRRLIRVGLDNVAGYITQLDGYVDESERTSVPTVEAEEVNELINQGAKILDVRSTTEHKEFALPDSKNIQYGQLTKHIGELDVSDDQPLIVHCETGRRAAVALGILESHGYNNLVYFPGGPEAWRAYTTSA